MQTLVIIYVLCKCNLDSCICASMYLHNSLQRIANNFTFLVQECYLSTYIMVLKINDGNIFVRPLPKFYNKYNKQDRKWD